MAGLITGLVGFGWCFTPNPGIAKGRLGAEGMPAPLIGGGRGMLGGGGIGPFTSDGGFIPGMNGGIGTKSLK